MISYIKIKDILSDDSFEKFDNINLYGVLTYISLPKLTKLNCYSVSITLVDDSCDVDDKLKCGTFSGDISKSIYSLCKKGDIIRFHRLKIQKYNELPQGLASFYSSWVAFYKDGNDFEVRTNKENISCIDDYDFQMVKCLRTWLKTCPKVNALYDNLTSERINCSLATKELNSNNSKMNLSCDLYSKKFTSISKVPEKGYFNMVCQICGICSSKSAKSLIVWTGHKSEMRFYKDEDWKLDSNVFIYIQDFEYYFQIYVFDEHSDLLEDLNPGDFIAMINLKSDKPKNLEKVVIKLSGGGQQYSRTIVKLHQENMSDNNDIKVLTDEIKKKGIELNILLLNRSQLEGTLIKKHFFNESRFEKRTLNESLETNDDVQMFSKLNEIEKNSEKQIDKLLEDKEDAYSTSNEYIFVENVRTAGVRNEVLINMSLFEDRTVKSKLIRLSKYMFFTKIETPSHSLISENSIELKNIHDLAKTVNCSFTCKCNAKIFNYFTLNNPLITFVNVFCKRCNYQNFLPFHFVNAHEPNIASKLFLIDNADGNLNFNQENKYYIYKQNYNIDWLFDAKPSNIISIENNNENRITSFNYDCPRCFWMDKESIKLEYVFRFIFTLIDNEKHKLGPCIIENDLAMKLFDTSALEFCCVPDKSSKVSDRILNLLNKEASFQLSVFNQENDSNVSLKEKIVFKIEDIDIKL